MSATYNIKVYLKGE